MLKKFFFLGLLICLSSVCFSQGGKKNKAPDSTNIIKGAVAATSKDKEGEQKKAASSKDDKKNESATKDIDSLKKIINDYEAVQSKNEKKIKKLEDEIKKSKADVNKNELAASTEMAPAWAMAGLAILAVLVIFLLYKNSRVTKENRRRQRDIDKYVNQEKSQRSIVADIDELRAKLKDTLQQNDILQKQSHATTVSATGIQFVPYVANAARSFIKSEIILSAGPRKDAGNSDTELGEDIAGSISLPNQTFFWILDGTSDSAAIKGLDIGENSTRHEEVHIFSSRLLAQSIGYYIQKNINHCFENKIELNELLTRAIAYVSGEWEKRLNNELPEKKESILQLIRKGFKPLCSTTVIIGRLLDDGHLYALRTGDSKLFPFKKSNGNLTLDKTFKFTADPTDEYDRIAFRLDFNESSQAFVIKQNIPKWLAQVTDNVHYVFAFTDGIGRVTEAQLASDNPGIVEMIRQNIARIPQKTHDDKTLVILERVIMN